MCLKFPKYETNVSSKLITEITNKSILKMFFPSTVLKDIRRIFHPVKLNPNIFTIWFIEKINKLYICLASQQIFLRFIVRSTIGWRSTIIEHRSIIFGTHKYLQLRNYISKRCGWKCWFFLFGCVSVLYTFAFFPFCAFHVSDFLNDIETENIRRISFRYEWWL